MNLPTNTKLEIVLSGAITTNQLQWTADYTETTVTCCGTPTESVCTEVLHSQGLTNNSTAVTMVDVPSTATDNNQEITRVINRVSVYNTDSVTAQVTIQTNNGTTTRIAFRATLDSGDNLIYADDGWNVLDQFGNIKTKILSVSTAIQSVAYSAVNGSANFSTLNFVNSNGISWSTSPAGIVGSVSGGGGASVAFSADQSSTFQTLSFQDSNGISFSNNAGGLRITHGLQYTSNTSNITVNAVNITDARIRAVYDGVNSLSTGTLRFSNSNGITFGLNGATLTASHNAITAQSTQPVAYSATNGSANFSTLSFADSNGVSFSTGTQGLYATVKTDYLTTARASTDGVGLNTAQTNVTWTVNSNGISFDASGYAGTATTFNGTNVSATVSLNSAGLNLSLSAPATATPTINISAGTTSNNLQSVVFSNSNNIQFGLSGSTITASYSDNDYWKLYGNTAGTTQTTLGTDGLYLAGGSGITVSGNSNTITIQGVPPITLSSYMPIALAGASTNTFAMPNATSNGHSLAHFTLNNYVSVGAVNMIFTANFTTVGTSSGRQTAGVAMALYSQGAGANSTALFTMASQSFSWQATGNNSSYTIAYPTTTAYSGYGAAGTINSAGVNITSQFTGGKLVAFPINTLLSPGNYWIGIIGTNSTSSVNVGLTMGWYGAVAATISASLAALGNLSSANTASLNMVSKIGFGGTWSSAGSVTNIASAIPISQISLGNSGVPIMHFWST